MTNVTLANAGPYSAVGSDTTGSVTSKVAVLEVDPMFVKITTDLVVTTHLAYASYNGAWADYNRDGSLDLLVTDGRALLYFNNNDGTFRQARTNEVGSWAGVFSSCVAGIWGDYDNDGWLDLFIPYPASHVFKNQRDGTMSPARSAEVGAIVSSQRLGGSILADFNNDGYLDVLAGGYRNPSKASYLFTNDGAGRFTQVTQGELVTTVSPGVEVSASDYDDDGYLDVLVSNTWRPELTESQLPPYLWHNNGDGTFTRVTDSPISAHLRAAHGSAWGDYNNDGKPDLFITATSIFPSAWPRNGLFRNDGGTFTEITEGPIPNEGGLSTAAGWGDCDNDGFLDLLVTNFGPDVNGITTAAKRFLYHNNGDGTFAKVTTGSLVNDLGIGNSLSWADYDGDGFLDLFVAATDVNFLYRNNGPAIGNTNAWIIVNLRGTKSNSFGVGAKVRLWAHYRGQDRQQLREVFGGDGFSGGPPLYAHFGLGDAINVATLRIEWPSGVVQELPNLKPKQYLTVWEPPALQAAIHEDGACLLQITAEPNRPWRIEASADMKMWEKLATVNSSSPTFGYADTASAHAACFFYRVVAE